MKDFNSNETFETEDLKELATVVINYFKAEGITNELECAMLITEQDSRDDTSVKLLGFSYNKDNSIRAVMWGYDHPDQDIIIDGNELMTLDYDADEESFSETFEFSNTSNPLSLLERRICTHYNVSNFDEIKWKVEKYETTSEIEKSVDEIMARSEEYFQ